VAAQVVEAGCFVCWLQLAPLASVGFAGIQAAFGCQAAKDPVLGKTCTVALENDVATY